MIQIAVGIVAGVFAVLPALLVTPKRRQLNHIKEEAAVIKEMPEGPARRNLEAAHVASTEAYERRIKGLDRVDILRRRLGWLFPVGYLGFLLAAGAIIYADRLADQLGVKEGTAATGMNVAGALLLSPLVVTVLQLRTALRERDERLKKEVERLEKVDASRAATAAQRESFQEALRKLQDQVAGDEDRISRDLQAQLARLNEGVARSAVSGKRLSTGTMRFVKNKDGRFVAVTKEQGEVAPGTGDGKPMREFRTDDAPKSKDEDGDEPTAPVPVS